MPRKVSDSPPCSEIVSYGGTRTGRYDKHRFSRCQHFDLAFPSYLKKFQLSRGLVFLIAKETNPKANVTCGASVAFCKIPSSSRAFRFVKLLLSYYDRQKHRFVISPTWFARFLKVILIGQIDMVASRRDSLGRTCAEAVHDSIEYSI